MASKTIDRAAMERALAQGGTVLYDDPVSGVKRQIRNHEDLPSEADLATTHDERTMAKARLEAQIKAAEASIKAIDEAEAADKKAAAAQDKADAKEERAAHHK